jgi:hypothetical protein
MALDWVQVSLRGYGGPAPSGTSFFDLLALEPGDGFSTSPSDTSHKAARVELVEVTMDDCLAAPEPHEEFAARLDAGLDRAARWLMARPPGAFEQWRSAGRKADIFVGGWLNDQQFDLVLPAPFLVACGQCGLPINICTND